MKEINSKFKYTMDLGVSATKSTFKLKRTKKDKIAHILVVVFMFLMTGVLVWDIVRDASFVIDLIILIALVGVEVFNLVMPFIILHIQKKFLKELNLAEIEYTITAISKDKCTESYYKNNKIVMQNVCDISTLAAYEIKDNHVFVVFNNFACAIFDVNTLSIPLQDFEQFLNTTISKNKIVKHKQKA